VPVLFTEAARFRSWLDVEAALAELTIIPAEMPDSGIHGMRIGLCFRRSLISASGQLRAIPAPEVPARSDPAANPAASGCRAPISAIDGSLSSEAGSSGKTAAARTSTLQSSHGCTPSWQARCARHPQKLSKKKRVANGRNAAKARWKTKR
jgi:hypothetical protein